MREVCYRSDKLEIYAPFTDENGDIDKVKTGECYADAQKQPTRSLFASFGLAAECWRFTVRGGVSIENLIKWNDEYYFITSVTSKQRDFLEIDTAKVRISSCVCRHASYGRTQLNNPEVSSRSLTRFYGVLCEKYIKNELVEPYRQETRMVVLVTPKAVTMQAGDTVIVDGVEHELRIAHTLDPHKNEFELERRCDV